MFRKLSAALVAVLFSTAVFAAQLPSVPSTPTFSEASQIVKTVRVVSTINYSLKN